MKADAGTEWLWEGVEVDEELAPFEYLLTNEMIQRYREVVGNPSAAFPTVAGRHALRAFNQRYGVRTLANVGVEAEYFAEVVPDKVLKVTARISDKYMRRGKPYIIVDSETHDEDERLIERSRLIGLAAGPDKPLFAEVSQKWEK